MKSYCLALAALAAIGFAGAAYAGDATAPKAMSDSEMDKVTAGTPPPDAGSGNFRANIRSDGRVTMDNAFVKTGGRDVNGSSALGGGVGFGVCTAGLDCSRPLVPPPH
jgi:hypothetical protein